MLEIIIQQPGQKDVKAKLPPGTYLVGSAANVHIALRADFGIAPQHLRLVVHDQGMDVTDLGASEGVFVNGIRLTQGQTVTLQPHAEVKIGRVTLLPEGLVGLAQPIQPVSSPVIEKKDEKSEPTPTFRNKSAGQNVIPILAISGILEVHRPLVQEIKRHAHIELIKRLNLKRLATSGISDSDLESKAKLLIHEILQSLTIQLPPGVTLEKIERELVNEAIGLGPLEELLAMPEVTEIMVNGPLHVYVEKSGKIYRTDTAFADDQQVSAAIERIVSPLGRRIDESSPMVDARLKDGSRVNAIIPPLSLVGPSITIRKFSKTPLQVSDLVGFGSLTYEMADFLNICVQLRKNIIISGGTGSGKTTLLNVLSSYLPNTERIVTIEDAAELQLRQEHVVRLESRPPNIEGKGEIAIRDLVRNSLRMRPDRIVIGECRGGEALDMLQAMNTGHDGSLTTVHANSPRDALARLETLVLMAGFDLPLRAIREQIASAIAIIVQINREKDGSRKVTSISEITKMEGEMITLQELFKYESEGWTPDGKLIGRHKPTGGIPTFMDDIKRSGLELDIGIFTRGGNF